MFEFLNVWSGDSQFNVAIFLLDRRITKLDARHNTEAYKSMEHKMYMKSINDTVFGVVIVGTVVGLTELFMFRSASIGLLVLVVGPPTAGIIIHHLKVGIYYLKTWMNICYGRFIQHKYIADVGQWVCYTQLYDFSGNTCATHNFLFFLFFD